MKYIFIIIFLSSTVFGLENKLNSFTTSKIPKNMDIATKKKRFYDLLVPAVNKVHTELMSKYLKIKEDIINKKNTKEIQKLKLFMLRLLQIIFLFIKKQRQ